MAYTWDKSIKGGACKTLSQIIILSYVVSVVNIITDWVCAIMPAVILWDIQLRRGLKISVGILLGMGAL